MRKLPTQEERVETGPVQFGEDWPGLFIRGDNAVFLRMALYKLIKDAETETSKDQAAKRTIESLIEQLDSCLIN